MRSTHPFEQEEVMAYLDGEVAADRASEIAQHMQKCAECQALASTFRDLSRDLSAWEIEPSPAHPTERVNEWIATASAQTPQPKPGTLEMTPLQRLYQLTFSWKQGRVGWALSGALATILLLVTISRLNPMRTPKAAMFAKSQSLVTLSNPGTAADSNGLFHGLGDRAKTSFSVDGQPISDQQGKVYSNQIPPNPSSPMIARTASLSLVVKNFTGIEAAVKAVVSRHSGYIGELNTATPPDAAKTFSATLRVPSGQLEPALAELKQLGRVDQASQSGEEVTKQYVDLAARLKNSRATEERLLGVLRNNTGKVKDVLEVENEIARVRGEIEEMEADQRALQTRIDFATITLSVTEEYKASLNAASSSIGTRLHNAFVAGYHGVEDNVIGVLAWLLESGPTLLLWAALLFFPARWAWRRVRRAFDRAPKPAAA